MNSGGKLCVAVAVGVAAMAVGYATAPRLSTRQVAPRAAGGEAASGQVSRALPRPGLAPRVPTTSRVALKSSADLRKAALGGDSPRAMFDRDERDDRWAPQVEAVFRDRLAQLQRDVLPYGKELTFECRARACRMALAVPAERFKEASAVVQSFPLGGAFEPHGEDIDGQPGQARLTLTVIYLDDQLDVTAIRARFEREIAERFPHGFPWVRKWLDEHPDELSGDSPPGGKTP